MPLTCESERDAALMVTRYLLSNDQGEWLGLTSKTLRRELVEVDA